MTSQINQIMQQNIEKTAPAAVLLVSKKGQIQIHRAYGWLDPESKNKPAQTNTLFDLASVTKLFTATAFMQLVEAGKVTLDTPLSTVLPEFSGERPIQPYEDPLGSGEMVAVKTANQKTVDAGRITFRQLLAHTSGLPAWRPLYRQPDRDTAVRLALNTFFAYVPGEHVIYSDIGLILLGLAIEKLTNLPLDTVIQEIVCVPLGLAQTTFRPLECPLPYTNLAPSEFCIWRHRRIMGEVHDENAACLGGVSGHAGLFSTAADLALFGQSFLYASLLKAETIAEMTALQSQEGDTRRGLGFLLWSPNPDRVNYPLGQRAFGHTGFTGTSMWIEPEKELVVVLLTNRVYYGRNAEKIRAFRVQVHEAINKTYRI